MATVVIQKRKGKKGMSYAIRYTHPLTGRKKYYKTFRKQKEAQRAANDLRTLLDEGKTPQKRNKKLTLLTFGQVSSSLKEEWDKRFDVDDLSKKTFQEYCIWLNVLNRVFGKNILCQITKDEIDTYRNSLAVEHSNVTANKYLSIIKKVFNHGIGLHALILDISLEIPYLSEKEHVRNRFLLPLELDRLIEASRKNRAKYYLPAIICLGAEHGASKQEILSLQWKDMDFDYAGKGLIRFFRTKNSRERTEFLMPRAKEALLVWRSHLSLKREKGKIGTIKSDYVFCRIKDGTPIKNFNNAWWTSLKEAGIKDFHFHDLRHTFCSNLILAGSGLKEVKEMIGHSDISMTDRYSHLTINHKLLQQNQLASHYNNGEDYQNM